MIDICGLITPIHSSDLEIKYIELASSNTKCET